MSRNIDIDTVRGFGDEWAAFDQSPLAENELLDLFERYFALVPWERLPANAQAFDLGCGSGRWARFVAPRVGRLHCIDPSPSALNVARKTLSNYPNCTFHEAGVDDIPLSDTSMDFCYCLGVLHHVPNTADGIASCASKLRSGGVMLLYLYYAFDNRPAWFRSIWKTTDLFRSAISRLPSWGKRAASETIAASVYYPLARGSRLLEQIGKDVSNFPLSDYRNREYYIMRNDALDRFGTRLEQRFTKSQIRQMMESAGLTEVRFADGAPYWCAVGVKR